MLDQHQRPSVHRARLGVVWSMLQFIVVAVTVVGIYYQLRSSQSANAFTQLGALVDEWTSRQRESFIARQHERSPG